jgi:DnaJ-class molecular chaperone
MATYYTIFNILPTTSTKEIKERYKQFYQIYKDNVNVLKKYHYIYKVLTNNESRKKYDEMLQRNRYISHNLVHRSLINPLSMMSYISNINLNAVTHSMEMKSSTVNNNGTLVTKRNIITNDNGKTNKYADIVVTKDGKRDIIKSIGDPTLINNH